MPLYCNYTLVLVYYNTKVGDNNKEDENYDHHAEEEYHAEVKDDGQDDHHHNDEAKEGVNGSKNTRDSRTGRMRLN